MALDFSDDYGIWDNPEAVTLVVTSSLGTTTQAVPVALRLPITAREMAASAGAYIANDVRFLLPVDELSGAEPKPGDYVRDTSNNEYAILDRSYSALTYLFRCTCRNLALAYGLRDLANVHRSRNPSTTGATRLGDYDETPVYANVLCKIQEISGAPVDGFGKDEFNRVLKMYSGTRLYLEREDQVRLNGTVYQVTGWSMPDRYDQLMEIDLEIGR